MCGVGLKWLVYIVSCSDGTYYTGVTTNVDRRISEHNHSIRGAKYTRTRRPVKLMYVEQCEDRSEAQRVEYNIKKMTRAQKEDLVAKFNRERNASNTRQSRKMNE